MSLYALNSLAGGPGGNEGQMGGAGDSRGILHRELRSSKEGELGGGGGVMNFPANGIREWCHSLVFSRLISSRAARDEVSRLLPFYRSFLSSLL